MALEREERRENPCSGAEAVKSSSYLKVKSQAFPRSVVFSPGVSLDVMVENISSARLCWTHQENISSQGSPSSPWHGRVWLCWTIEFIFTELILFSSLPWNKNF